MSVLSYAGMYKEVHVAGSVCVWLNDWDAPEPTRYNLSV